MYIASLQLQNYRNYEEARIDFSERTNLILGDNGRGKTNLLESIYLLSTSKSFRNASDQKLAQWGRDGYLVSATFHDEGGGESSVVLEYRDHKKILSINGVREKRISDLIGQIFCILLSFEDIALVTGPPYLRRGFLDLILSTVDPLYFETLKTYLQVIKQKNRYLRDAVVCEEDLLKVWNDQLSEAGTYILRKRIELIGFFNRYTVSHAEELTQFSSPLRFMYRSTIPGIGEDDGEEDLRYFGSVGEARLSSIVLKLAQGAYYRDSRHILPIVLVDDILLELDSRNREHVLSLFGKDNQLLITTTERLHLLEIFSPDRVFHIRGEGCIEC